MNMTPLLKQMVDKHGHIEANITYITMAIIKACSL